MEYFFKPYNDKFKRGKYIDYEEGNKDYLEASEKIFNLVLNQDKDVFKSFLMHVGSFLPDPQTKKVPVSKKTKKGKSSRRVGVVKDMPLKYET